MVNGDVENCRDGSRKDRPGAPPVNGLIESVSGPRPSALPPRLVCIIVVTMYLQVLSN